jgi:hypothetical protein
MVSRNITLGVLALVLVSTLVAAPVAAQETTPKEDEEEEEDDPAIDLSGITEAIDDLAEAFNGFTENWDKILAETLKNVFYEPFQILVGHALSPVVNLLTFTPDVHPNPAVEDVHNDVLIVTYALSGLVFIVAGILHMVGPVLGFSYGEIRNILPRVVIALVFSTVSLPLLQLAVEFTEALTQAFEPALFDTSFQQLLGLSTGLIIAYIIQSILLVAVALLFLIRDIYILFVAAISPLLAPTWSIPQVKRYGDTFIAGWFAALMIAPLDMLVLKFSFAMMTGAGADIFQGVSNWLLGIASLLLLLLVPKQIWDTSQTAVGMTYAASSTVKERIRSEETREESLLNEDQRERLREHRRKRKASKSMNISYPWRDDS